MIGKSLQQALGVAVHEVKQRRHEYLTLEHLLFGIASEVNGRRIIEACGGDIAGLRRSLDHFFTAYMESLDEVSDNIYQTLAVQRVMDQRPFPPAQRGQGWKRSRGGRRARRAP